MNMILDTANAVSLAIQITDQGGDIGMKPRFDLFIDSGRSVFRAEDDMSQNMSKGLRHGPDVTGR